MFEEITQDKAAEEQLITSIKLYFEGYSPVSVHTLIRASHDIFDALCEKKGLERSVIYQGSKWIKPEMLDLFHKKISEAKNFFKHAYSQPKNANKINWNPEISKHYILDTISLYSRISNGKLPCEMMAFKIWYRIDNPEMWDDNTSPIATAFNQASELLKETNKKESFEILLEVCRKNQNNYLSGATS